MKRRYSGTAGNNHVLQPSKRWKQGNAGPSRAEVNRACQEAQDKYENRQELLRVCQDNFDDAKALTAQAADRKTAAQTAKGKGCHHTAAALRCESASLQKQASTKYKEANHTAFTANNAGRLFRPMLNVAHNTAENAARKVLAERSALQRRQQEWPGTTILLVVVSV
ncbi:hypothetical protein WJX73_003961 [Symbiochloris irregularis]|uniref:Uncharacterized protein n=1 Tax=Symbiochloris irregularis TaxID=706552 RepID=A0AAW1P617_9CHLO